ncbi:winged helix DNA-binding domain-containing protein [Oryzobacter telluris]|uniref:winged helix DNA-binding domain-containing protein n=1 Tax=Oryzobacter telluris TaxID=3149179 RepID=UPI00370D3AA4
METLDRRQLTLATLDRQLLLRRHDLGVEEAVTHLVGLQAQEPLEPYTGLWSRLAGFDPLSLVAGLEDRTLVRTLTMRRTLHLHTAADCLALRPAHQGMLLTKMLGIHRRTLEGVDLDALTALATPLFAAEPRTGTDVAREVGVRWPHVEARWLGDALTCLVPLVQVPPRGVWGRTAPARLTTVGAWLGEEPASPPDVLASMVVRYLRAFGPASSSDLRAWCGVPGLPAVVKELRPTLVSYRDESGRELLDVADGTLPMEDAEVPVRFLPAFDNTVLGYDDRRRVIDDEHRGLSVSGARFVLVDGRVAAVWVPRRPVADGPVTVGIELLRALTPSEADAVVEEGRALAAFLADGTPGDVEVATA